MNCSGLVYALAEFGQVIFWCQKQQPSQAFGLLNHGSCLGQRPCFVAFSHGPSCPTSLFGGTVDPKRRCVWVLYMAIQPLVACRSAAMWIDGWLVASNLTIPWLHHNCHVSWVGSWLRSWLSASHMLRTCCLSHFYHMKMFCRYGNPDFPWLLGTKFLWVVELVSIV